MVLTAVLRDQQELAEILRSVAGGDTRWGLRATADGHRISLVGSKKVLEQTAEHLRCRTAPHLVRNGEFSVAEWLMVALQRTGSSISCAESCTGGLVAKLITDIPGSSDVFKGAAVVYSNSIKTGVLSVNQSVIDEYGAVSAEVVVGMATGALGVFSSDLAVAISGIAGPGGGTLSKPVGTVWIAAMHRDGRKDCRRFRFGGGRVSVRTRAAVCAMLQVESMAYDRGLPILPEQREQHTS